MLRTCRRTRCHESLPPGRPLRGRSPARGCRRPPHAAVASSPGPLRRGARQMSWRDRAPWRRHRHSAGVPALFAARFRRRSVVPSSSNCNAAPSPISRGSIQLAPISGRRPIRMNGGNRAIVGDPTRMSQASASDIPPPTAGPSMAAIVGCGNAHSKSTTRISRANNSATSASDCCERCSSAPKSAPALNAPLAPVRINALTAESVLMSANS